MTHQAFYSTVATVIPIIFVMLAFQSGYFTFTPPESHGRHRTAGFALYRLAMLFALASSEFLALNTLANAHDGGRGARTLMLYAIYFAGIEVVAPYVRAQSSLFNEHTSEKARRWMSAVIVVGGLVWITYLVAR